MTANKTTLQAEELARRAHPWHALAALKRGSTHVSGTLFMGVSEAQAAHDRQAPPDEAARPPGQSPSERGLRVRGSVPIDCLRIADVMD